MASNRRLIFSVLVGLLAALFVYDSFSGISWTAVILLTVCGLVAVRRPDVATRRALIIPLGFAVILAGALTATADDRLAFIDLVTVASLLALALLVSRDPARANDYGTATILGAPFRGLALTLKSAVATSIGLIHSRTFARLHPALRGALLAIPVVIVFALLFASADPVFASGRDFVYNAFSSWPNVPRIIFGAAVALFVAGAYGASLPIDRELRSSEAVASPDLPPARQVTSVERGIVLWATAGICWLFVLLQLGYLFRADPASVGSGVTFAQYARQGFGELAVAATIAVLVIVAAHSDFPPAKAAPRVRKPLAIQSLALLAAVACILCSAFHRISLYENAYGYSTQRVYAQAYIILAGAVLIAVAWHVLHAFDVRALARNVMTVALATFAFLVYWNSDAWVVHANINRFARTGKLDVTYLIHGLSRDAHPAIVAALPQLPEPDRTMLVATLTKYYGASDGPDNGGRWYEWNLRRAASRRAIRSIGVRAP